jgi:hypothetical protein
MKNNTFFAAVLLCIMSNACFATDNYLVLNMHLDDGTADDSSSYSNNGAVSGASWTTAGKVGGAMSFDGMNDYMTIPNSASLDISGATPYAISMWVRGLGSKDNLDDANQNVETLLSKQPIGSCSGGYFFLYINNDSRLPQNRAIEFAFSQGCSTESYILSTKKDWDPNKWYHIVGTWDGTTNQNSMKIYVNGDLDAQATAQYPTIMQNTAPVWIGAWPTGPSAYYKGQIDEVKIYRRALTADEIKTLYNHPDEFLVLDMHLNNNATEGDSPTKAVDSSRYKNNGTIEGPVWSAGRLDGALSFDGTDDYVSMPHSTSLNIEGASPFSIDLWVRGINSTSDSLNMETIITKTPTGSCSGGYYIWYDKGRSGDQVKDRLNFGFHHDCSQASVVSSNRTNWDPNAWYHIVGTWDGTTNPNSLKLYINGALDAQTTPQYPTILGNTANLLLGKWGTNNDYYKGQIDEVKIYRRALTADEIKAQYDSAPATTTTTTSTVATTTTLATTTSQATTTHATTTSTTSTSTTTTTIISSKIAVSRQLPTYGYKSSEVTVSLTMDVNESNKPNAVGLTEYYPEGWNVSSVSLGGVLKTSPSRIEWLFSTLANPVQDYAINYTLTIPSTANGSYSFSGSSDIGNGTAITTTGDYLLPVRSSALSDVINIINDWTDGNANLLDVIAMINAWANSN